MLTCNAIIILYAPKEEASKAVMALCREESPGI